MAKIQDTQSFGNKPVNDVYQAILKAAPQAGLKVWKQRDIAWLVMVRSVSERDGVDGNISTRPGGQVTVSLSSAGLTEPDLQKQAAKIFEEIARILE